MTKAVFIEKPNEERIHVLLTAPENEKSAPEDKKTLVIMCHHFPGDCKGTQNILIDMEKTVLKCGLYSLRIDFSHCGNSDGEENGFTLQTAMNDLKIIIFWAHKQGFKHIGFIGEGLGVLPPVVLGDKYIDFMAMVCPVIDAEDAYNLDIVEAKEQKRFSELLTNLHEFDLEKSLRAFQAPSLIFYGTNDSTSSSLHLNILRESLGSRRIDMTSIKGGTFGLPEISARKAIAVNLNVFLEKYAICFPYQS